MQEILYQHCLTGPVPVLKPFPGGREILEDRDEAATAIRGLIERIVMRPGEKWGEVHARLHGDLGTILEWTAKGDGKNRGRTSPPGLSVSAETGARFGLDCCHA